MSEGMRATREEIFMHVRAWVGEEAIDISIQVADEYINRNKDVALQIMKDFDVELGGIGIYRGNRKNYLEFIGHFRTMKYQWFTGMRTKVDTP